MGGIAVAQAADCPRQGTLGTSRVLSGDAATSPMRIKPGQTTEEIDRSILEVETVLHGVATTIKHAFFAFPVSSRRQRHLIFCNRAESWCSVPIFGQATGIP